MEKRDFFGLFLQEMPVGGNIWESRRAELPPRLAGIMLWGMTTHFSRKQTLFLPFLQKRVTHAARLIRGILPDITGASAGAVLLHYSLFPAFQIFPLLPILPALLPF